MMEDAAEFWARSDVRHLEWQYLQRQPNVTKVLLNPPDVLGDVPQMPFGCLWIVQGRVAYGVPLVFN